MCAWLAISSAHVSNIPLTISIANRRVLLYNLERCMFVMKLTAKRPVLNKKLWNYKLF